MEALGLNFWSRKGIERNVGGEAFMGSQEVGNQFHYQFHHKKKSESYSYEALHHSKSHLISKVHPSV